VLRKFVLFIRNANTGKKFTIRGNRKKAGVRKKDVYLKQQGKTAKRQRNRKSTR
jgi:hypothetical protein